MERAKKAYEDAIICCGLTAAELELAEETTLEQLAGYLKIARAAADAAEQAYKDAKAKLELAQSEKTALNEAYADIVDLADQAEAAMKTAQSALEKIEALPRDTEEQQAAYQRA
jgi:hypothetical protein